MRKALLVAFLYLVCSSVAAFAQGRDVVAPHAGDTEITARVKAALIDNEATKARQIDVETRDGVVQLSGFVASQAMQEAALKTARAVPGVREVRNDLGLRGSERPVGRVVDDSVIAARVKAKLIESGHLAAPGDVNVEVNHGMVQLSGFVATSEEKVRAADAASEADGVKDVSNHIALAQRK